MDNSAQGVSSQPVVGNGNPPSQVAPSTAQLANAQLPVTPPVVQPEPEMLTDAVTNTAPVSQQPAVPAPVSLPHREAGPGLGRMSEFVQPANPEPVLAPEVKEAGVEVSPDLEQPQIPVAVAQAGVQPAKAAVPIQPVTGAKVEYITDAPFTQEVAQKVEKSKRASDSIRWLATFLLKQIKRVKLIGK